MGKRVQDKKKIAERRALRKQQKRNKILAALIISAVFVAAILVIYYISSIPHYVKIEEVDGKYIDAENKITYLPAPGNYEPVSYSRSSPYGKLDDLYVYPITEKSANEWLVVNSFETPLVLYNEELSLPALDGFSPNRIQICKDTASRNDKIAEIEEEQVSHVIDDILNGDVVEQPTSSEAKVYTMRISSQEYSWLYYCVKYLVYDEGEFYYDSLTKRFVKADDTVWNCIFGERPETDASTDETSSSTEEVSDTSKETSAELTDEASPSETTPNTSTEVGIE